jgi:hypothetical protein
MPNEHPPPRHPRSSALAQLRRGEIDREGYLDAKVRKATAHLWQLSTSDLLWIQRLLRELLDSDPILAHFVRRVFAPKN